MNLSRISGSDCMRSIKRLYGMGIRVAGTPGEKKAADWIEGQFKALRLKGIHQEEFPCLTFGHKRCRVSALDRGRWKTVKAEPAAHSPPTPKAGVKGKLVVVEQVPASSSESKALIEGKVLLMYGSLLFELSLMPSPLRISLRAS